MEGIPMTTAMHDPRLPSTNEGWVKELSAKASLAPYAADLPWKGEGCCLCRILTTLLEAGKTDLVLEVLRHLNHAKHPTIVAALWTSSELIALAQRQHASGIIQGYLKRLLTLE